MSNPEYFRWIVTREEVGTIELIEVHQADLWRSEVDEDRRLYFRQSFQLEWQEFRYGDCFRSLDDALKLAVDRIKSADSAAHSIKVCRIPDDLRKQYGPGGYRVDLGKVVDAAWKAEGDSEEILNKPTYVGAVTEGGRRDDA